MAGAGLRLWLPDAVPSGAHLQLALFGAKGVENARLRAGTGKNPFFPSRFAFLLASLCDVELVGGTVMPRRKSGKPGLTEVTKSG